MDIRWTKNCKSEADREKVVKSFNSYKRAFKDLSEMLEILRKKPSRNYEAAGWAQEQIAVNEYNAALDDLQKLIKE
jgi:hypothetical protein